MSTNRILQRAAGRRRFVMFVFACLGLAVLGRAAWLQIWQHGFLLGQAQARQHRVIEIPAHRGTIFDRNGEPLAVSTPIDTVWAVPGDVLKTYDAMQAATDPEARQAYQARWDALAEALSMSPSVLHERVSQYQQQGRAFQYLRRHVTPAVAEQVAAQHIPGVSLMREYARYYPSSEASAHIVGFTNIDDKGTEGLELAYDRNWLAGQAGKRRIVRDLAAREIESLEIVQQAKPGKDLYLSVDRRLQYQAFRALDKAVKEEQASSGSLVLLDVQSGEVLAIVNSPSYNPNNTAERRSGVSRNRAVTDQFEPGSTMKPFTIAAALESGRFTPSDIIYTSPGYYKVGRYEIRDTRDYGWLDLRGIIKKSSNVGVIKVAQKLEPEQMWSVLDRFGFGRPPGSEFPGEVPGKLNHPTLWHSTEQTTLAYGYGLATSALQLTHAVAAIANGGVMQPVSFLKRDEPVQGERVLDESVARQVASMMESVVSKSGTGYRARVPGYRVAGKTGTSYKSHSGGYNEERYISLFAGFAPASAPRLAMVVVIHDPSAGQHYGGQVAAPVFSEVMGNALRVLGVKPDDWDSLAARVRDEVTLEDAL
ncbi:penicillin-binding protein 2 [Granulosicoccaceae sp. 1_MG-2023]|nr:penicillin-binding protein 2 [Granulosicoccaceae sp. 1_MG-2023]